MKSMNELSSAVAINPQRVDPVPSFRSIVFCFVFVFSVCSILNGFSYPAGFDNKKFVFFFTFFFILSRDSLWANEAESCGFGSTRISWLVFFFSLSFFFFSTEGK